MATNKFATMLLKNTNNLTLILVYTFLEWLLIILLFINSLFSYLIIKFADYFRLKTPCILCSRLDHVFDSTKFRDCYRSLVCEDHGVEISRLGYCFDHKKLVESHSMCRDCLVSEKFAFFPWSKQLGASDNLVEMSSKCSCCGACIDGKFCGPDWENLDFEMEGNWLALESRGDDHEFVFGSDDEDVSREIGVSYVSIHDRDVIVCDDADKVNMFMAENYEELDADDCGKVDMDMEKIGDEMAVDDSEKVDIGCDGTNVVEEAEEVEKKYSEIVATHTRCSEAVVASDMCGVEATMNVVKEAEPVKEEKLDVPVSNMHCNEAVMGQVIGSEDISEEKQPQHLEFFFDQENCDLIPVELMESKATKRKVRRSRATRGKGKCGSEDFVLEFDGYGLVVDDGWDLDEDMLLFPIQECEEEDEEEDKAEALELEAGGPVEINCSLGVKQFEELTEQELKIDDSQFYSVTGQETNSVNDQVDVEVVDQVQIEETEQEIPIEMDILDEEHIDDVQIQDLHPFTCAEGEFPTSNGDYHAYADDNPDSTQAADEVEEFGDWVVTVEKLKSALRTQRNALDALYAELDEERNASAVAASETMAMINRLQEEKASMQMEAFQYQRIMEEQADYDQEALQLMNEKLVKYKNEKAELENELEVYRKKVHDYELKERMGMLRDSSASFSSSDDSDEVSIDLNREMKEQNTFDNHKEVSNQNTPLDAVLFLEDSLSTYDEERLSILEQFKILQQNLFNLGEEEENGNDCNKKCESNGYANGHKRGVFGTGKALLPQFNAAYSKPDEEIDTKKLAFEDEVDRVYERLRVLEADRVFLKQCMTSLTKGDKGLELLQEILQHLRDLRRVDLHGENVIEVVL